MSDPAEPVAPADGAAPGEGAEPSDSASSGRTRGARPQWRGRPPPMRKPRNLGDRIVKSRTAQRAVAQSMHVVFEWARYVGRERASRIAGRVVRVVGPYLREDKIGRANLAAAFPEKSAEERDAILRSAWESLASATIEYAFLTDLVEAFDPDKPTGGVIEHHGIEHAYALRDGGKPGIIFGAHLANWELPAAIGAKIGLPVTAIYREPTNPYVAAEIERRRAKFIGKLVVSGHGAAMRIANALQAGSHVGIVVDQRIWGAPEVPFFGRPSQSNPVVGALARLFDCPVHGVFAVRRPDGTFFMEMTPPLDLPRDARGRVHADKANVMIHKTVEDWVRREPGQWLWFHDRWRQ